MQIWSHKYGHFETDIDGTIIFINPRMSDLVRRMGEGSLSNLLCVAASEGTCHMACFMGGGRRDQCECELNGEYLVSFS